MVSPGPKGVLIKEAKVKKPSTVPLVNAVASSKVCITCRMEKTAFCGVTAVEFQQLSGGTVCFHFTLEPLKMKAVNSSKMPVELHCSHSHCCGNPQFQNVVVKLKCLLPVGYNFKIKKEVR
jgi:hypothetical protein